MTIKIKSYTAKSIRFQPHIHQMRYHCASLPPYAARFCRHLPPHAADGGESKERVRPTTVCSAAGLASCTGDGRTVLSYQTCPLSPWKHLPLVYLRCSYEVEIGNSDNI